VADRIHHPRIVGFLAVLVWALTTVSPAAADPPCDLFDDIARCEGGGGGGGGEPDPSEPPYYFEPWVYRGVCDWSDALLYERLKIWTDGSGLVEVERVCVDPGEGEDEAWDELVEAIEALSDPRWESSPDNAIGPGLTGLDTWLWYSGQTQIGPVDATWADPVVGVVFEVQGRAWSGELAWSPGTGDVIDRSVTTFEEAAEAGGSKADPVETYMYEVSAADAGHEGGYPVEMSILWVGEWRTRVVGGVWSAWSPMPNTYLDTFNGTYDVWQIRGVLTG